MKTENVIPGFRNVKKAIDLDKCKFEKTLIQVHSGENRPRTGGMGNGR